MDTLWGHLACMGGSIEALLQRLMLVLVAVAVTVESRLSFASRAAPVFRPLRPV